MRSYKDNPIGFVKFIFILIACFQLLPIIAPFLTAFGLAMDDPTDYARITNVDYKAVLVDEPNSEGKMVVTERITFDIHAADPDDPFWELWRDMPEKEVDGVNVYYKVNSVKQILPNGSTITWPESPEVYYEDYDYVKENETLGPGKWFYSPGPYNEYTRDYECLLFYIDGVYRDEMTFEIEYEIYNVALRYADCSDIYLGMYSGDTIKYLESFNAEILIPNKDMPQKGDYTITTYGTKDYTFPIEESATKNQGYHTFSINLTEEDLKFTKDTSYLEMELVAFGDSKHTLADYGSHNDYYDSDALYDIYALQDEFFEEAEANQKMKKDVFLLCGFVSFAIIGITVFYIISVKKKHNINLSKHKKETYRNIPSNLDPKFAAALVFCKDKKQEKDSDVYSAILLSLARKGYITLKENSYGDATIILNDVVTESTGNHSLNVRKTFKPNYDPIGSPYYSYNTSRKYDDPWDNEYTREEPLVSNENSAPVVPREPLTWSETHYLNLIKRHTSSKIDMKVFQAKIADDCNYTNDFAENIDKTVMNYGVKDNYFSHFDYFKLPNSLKIAGKRLIILGVLSLLVNLITINLPIGLAFGGFIILGITSLLTGICLSIISPRFALLTNHGSEEYKKWRGLYNFLKSDTLINERTVPELALWEKYLVYATAFGISEKVIEAIKIKCPEHSAYNDSTIDRTSIIYNNCCRSGRIRVHSTNIHRSVVTGTHISHARSSYGSSYSSYGGSRGGGGRGGGGGGGGH